MKKSHITDKGEMPCNAKTPESCPVKFNGEPAPHFKSMKEGREFFLSYLESKNQNAIQEKTLRKSSASDDRFSPHSMKPAVTTSKKRSMEEIRAELDRRKASAKLSKTFENVEDSKTSVSLGKDKVPKTVKNSGKRGANLSSNKSFAAKVGSRENSQKLPSPAELGFSTAHFQEWEDCQDNRFVPASFLKGQAGYQKFLSQLSEEQAIALNAYTGEDHFRFTNSFWRASQTERKELVAQHPQEVERAILIERYLSQAIRDNSDGTDKIVYRGVTGDFARQAALTPVGSTMKLLLLLLRPVN